MKKFKDDVLDAVFPPEVPDSDYDEATILALCEYGIVDPIGLATEEDFPVAEDEQDEFLSLLRRGG